ncbi:hypothetical protein Sste5346_006522 [Sporothrix stenoceras]|uniref:Xylanolytic transcriptional activator regulatory domain-containing protein n=1 Tax=Sporothrix stenoceras TaxID=5173 RepID=A0ABR3Z1F3_9PEZI
MWEEEDTLVPPEQQTILISRFKTALDQLLTVRHLINQPDIQCIQALAIYVTCLRAHEVGRSVWILNGLAIRLAQSMGLHRDGSHLKLSPFETEMRLRLWWHLCILDSRAPEDQGLQPTIAVTNWELRIPLNVNDAQLYPEMTELPESSPGWTDMSFFLLQTEACRRMHPLMETLERQSGAPPTATDWPKSGIPDQPFDIAEALRRIRARHETIRNAEQYMRSRFGVEPKSGLPTDLPRIATTHMATACKKMEFVLQLREEILLKRVEDKLEVPPLQTTSFSLACQALACSRTLKHDSGAAHYGWFFNMYTQWYALAYVLRCLCCSREAAMDAVAERAWSLVDELFPSGLRLHGWSDDGEGESTGTSDDGSIWSYLQRLRYQASLVREQARLDPLQSIVVNTEAAGLPQLDRQMQGGVGDASLPSAGLVQDNSQDLFSSLDLFMADIQFLPDWDTVINM